MQRIFIPPEQFEGNTARIIGQDHLHLTRVLRAKAGHAVILLDSENTRAFLATLIEISKSQTVARLEQPHSLPPEPPLFLVVAQALGKGDKFEQVIQHGTEAGAGAFLPIRSERCMVDIPQDRVTERVARWKLIAKGAAEQSGRSSIPEVSAPEDWKDFALRSQQQGIPCLLLHPESPASALRSVLQRWELIRSNPLHLMIGPEGGWSPKELETAREAGCELVSLGPRILRTETAALVAISQILYHFE